MGLIKITSDAPDDLFKPHEFPVLPAGKHLLIVANKLFVGDVKDPASTNKIIALEARCQDEDANKGMVVFDNFLIVTDISTDKQKKTKEIHDAKLAQFVVSCGVLTQAQLKAGEEFDLDDFEGKVFNAVTKVAMEDVYPPELDREGKPKKAQRAAIKQYLFEDEGDVSNPEMSG